MESILKILMVEDFSSDAELIKHQIRKSEILFIDKIVDTKESYIKALGDFMPDIILSDFTLPTFDGMQALRIREELAPSIPFILVTGSINEETAVEVMKAGADDYIIKGHITRIGAAIKQSLEKREIIRQKKAAEDQLKILSRAIEQNPASIVLTDIKGKITYVNPKFTELTGYSMEEVLGKNPRILKSGSKTPDFYKVLWNTILTGGEWHGEFENVKKNGEIYFESAHISPIAEDNGEITHFLAVKEDITDKKSTDKKVKLLDHSLESISECVLVTDNNLHIIYTNEAFNKTYGYEEGEVLGKHRNILLAPSSAPADATSILLETSKGHWRGEIMNRRKNGSLFPVLFSTSEIRDENENPLAQISVAMDITEMIKTREELLEAKGKSEETNRLRSALLNNLSHEVRTPMNAIMGFAGLMSEADENEKNSYAAIILKSSSQLLSLIDEVILLSRLQSEKMTINFSGISPAETVKDVFSMFTLRESKKKIELKTNIPEAHKDLVVLSDTNKVRQVLSNLTSNAIKYTMDGTIEIGFEVCNNKVEFYVKDTGIGIPENEQEKVFETFYRGEQAISSAIGGTGLGLSISRELVSLLGGTMGVNSIPDKGSRFFFTIPLKQMKQKKAVVPVPEQKPKEIEDLYILIVDDEAVNIHYLDVLLKNKAKKIDHAFNGKEAIEKAMDNNYNMVLMDIKMPIMGGIEATKILKAQKPDMVIIAQTAFTLPDDAARVLEAGCDDILCKPVRKEHLFDMVRKYS
jgi:PAS domain S-box-containing protein